MRTLRLGTRASTLARTQSSWVADALRALGWAVEIVPVRTEGDRRPEPLARIGGTGVFVAALREALLAGRVDLAVHSLKDLPTAPTPGVALAAVPVRERPEDVLCARNGWTLAELPAGSRVGTGSPRRAAQLRLSRPDLEVVDIRGNVDTRLSRVAGTTPGASPDLTAVVLARAGLARLGRLDAVTETLSPEVMLPAPGQGALAVECRSADAGRVAGAEGLGALDDAPTRLAVTAERALLAHLEAGCSAPVGALGRLEDDGTLHLQAVAVTEHGRPVRAHGRTAAADEPAAHGLGLRVADSLLGQGLRAAPRTLGAERGLASPDTPHPAPGRPADG